MSVTLRDLIAHRAADAGTPSLELDELVAAGERRLRRRRTAAVVGASVAVVGVIALVLVVVTLNGPVKRGEGPADSPTTENDRTAESMRRIVYSDVPLGEMGREIHLGRRAVDTGVGFVHLDATDAGFVYAYGSGVWFSDGGAPERIGSALCDAVPKGATARAATKPVVSANAGPLAAWMECPQGRREVVVFDTGADREVVRRSVTGCRRWDCSLVDLTTGYVYLDRDNYKGHPTPGYRIETETGQGHATTEHQYAADLVGHPRGLVVGDSWRSGAATNGIGQSFKVVGSRLVPQLYDVNVIDMHESRAFDTATGRRVRLTLPRGYRSIAEFQLFQWLDDDTVALGALDYGVTDILRCRLSDGRCELAVPETADDHKRTVPGLGLAG